MSKNHEDDFPMIDEENIELIEEAFRDGNNTSSVQEPPKHNDINPTNSPNLIARTSISSDNNNQYKDNDTTPKNNNLRQIKQQQGYQSDINHLFNSIRQTLGRFNLIHYLIFFTYLLIFLFLIYTIDIYFTMKNQLERKIQQQQVEIEYWSKSRFESKRDYNIPIATITPLPINKYKNYEKEFRKQINYTRITEFMLEYRSIWKSNNQVSFSDHVFLEPKWTIRMKCPTTNSEQNNNYNIPLQESVNNDIITEINPLTGKPKRLGVYLTLISIDAKTGLVRKENDKFENPYDGFLNWKNQFIKKYPHPLLIFYFGRMTKRIMTRIVNIFKDVPNLEITFERVGDISSRSFDGKSWKKDTKEYFTMSKFLGHDLYKKPILKNYVYYLRLDSDVRFTKAFTYDPFRFMYENRLLVGYGLLGMPESGYTDDYHTWTKTLQEKVHSYFLRQGVLPLEEIRPNGNYGWADTIHAGPMELNKISVFDNEQYYHFVESIDLWEGMTTYRWREQIFKTLWIKMYVPRMSMHWFCDLDVWHKINFRQRCTVVCV
ncbi:hypothetical protein ABK040_006984 [Willaertia magna]